MAEHALEALARTVRESGLIEPGSRGVLLVSGGPDSACLAAGCVAVCGPEGLSALHLNYKLRDDSDQDERTCKELCDRLGIELEVETPTLGEENLQAAAREARYAAAERLADLRGAAWIASGHTRSDVAETVLYRLAASPGRRALTGLPDRRGRLVRPLLSLPREETRRLATEAELPFRDDPSNLELRYARNRIRHEVMPVLGELGPAAERNIAETRAEIAEEARALERIAAEALEAAGAGPGAAAVTADALARLDPAVRRLALRAMAERTAGREVALGRERAAEIWRLARSPEGGEIELGEGLVAVCEQGLVRFRLGGEAAPLPARLTLPGRCRFGEWELRAELRGAPVQPAGPDLATLDAQSLGAEVAVRSWREGDRMRPLGLEGSKSLQDLFTDQGVPRSLRRTLPVVQAGDRIAWVAGVAISDDFKITDRTSRVAVLTARVAE
jgi:tRNA(Ile)-lysidine synthase